MLLGPQPPALCNAAWRCLLSTTTACFVTLAGECRGSHIFTIMFVAISLASGAVMLIILISVGIRQRWVRAAALQHRANHPEVNLFPSWLLQSPAPGDSWSPSLQILHL